MGVQLTPLACKLQSKMKSVVVAALCLFAAVAADAEAKPEAEADAYYGRYGYGLAHHGYGYGLGHHGYYGAYAHPYGAYGHYYGKRSAEAEAEPTAAAEPAADAYYGHHYGYGLAHHGYGYAHHGYYGYPYAARG